MAKITLSNFSTFQNDTTAVSTINSNNSLITTAFNNTLSRDGTSPNQMSSSLDMNNNQILNLPAPASTNSPARIIDVVTNPTITVPPTGTSGHTVPFLDVVNTWSANQVFNNGISGTLPLGQTQAINFLQQPNGSAGSPVNLNTILISPDVITAGANFVNGLTLIHGFGTSACTGGRQTLDVTMSLNSPTNSANPNRFYTTAILVAQAQTNDGGTGVAAEKGNFFALNCVGRVINSSTFINQVKVAEFDTEIQVGSSVADKYGFSVTQTSLDAVAGYRNDAACFFANQSGAVGWGTLFLIGDNINVSPLKTTGSVLAIKGSCTFANGIDFSAATSITGSAFKSNNFNVLGTGVTQIGTATSGFMLSVNRADSTLALFAGTTKGVRITNFPGFSAVEGVDNTGSASFQPLAMNGSTLAFQIASAQVAQFAASGGFTVGSAVDPGAGAILANTDLYSNNVNFLIRTKATLTNAAAAATATLTNAPTAGNPTKWISFDDNGTTRRIPAW